MHPAETGQRHELVRPSPQLLDGMNHSDRGGQREKRILTASRVAMLRGGAVWSICPPADDSITSSPMTTLAPEALSSSSGRSTVPSSISSMKLVEIGPTEERARYRSLVYPRIPESNRPFPRSGPSRSLHEADHIHITDHLREKAPVRTTAAELGRSPSTTSREIRRNGMPPRGDATRRAYRPHAAQSRADARRPRPEPGRIGQDLGLRDFIQRHLERRWRPERICQSLYVQGRENSAAS